jgi:hypothetical protein
MTLEGHRIAVALLGAVVLLGLAGFAEDNRHAGWPRLVSVAFLATITAYQLAWLLHDWALLSLGEKILEAATVALGCAFVTYHLFSIFDRKVPSAAMEQSLNRNRVLAVAVAGGAVLYGAIIDGLYDGSVTWVSASLALMVLLIWAAVFVAQVQLGRPSFAAPAALVLLSVASANAFTGFGAHTRFHALVMGSGSDAVVNLANDWTGIIYHDQFHYFLGAKYFPEIGYTRLYDCAAQARIENGMGELIAATRVRDLESNLLLPGDRFVIDPPDCETWFGADRWQDFRQDVQYFMSRVDWPASRRYLTDHGFNATPYWTALNALLVEDMMASDESARLLTFVDVILLLSVFGLFWWAFGLETAALAAFLVGTGKIWIYTNVGSIGSFGRMYFLCATVAALALLKKRQAGLAGAALAAAAMDRVFPGAMFLGPGCVMAWQIARRKWPDRRLLEFFTSAFLAVALATLLVAYKLDGTGAFQSFVANSLKHADTPLWNYMGLKTLFSYSPTEIDALWSGASPDQDPLHEWKMARQEAFEQRKPLFYASAFLLLLIYIFGCLRMKELWKMIAVGALPVFFLFELTNYYFIIMILLAPLVAGRLLHMVVLMGLPVAGAAAVRHFPEVVAYPILSGVILLVMLFFVLGEIYESYSIRRTDGPANLCNDRGRQFGTEGAHSKLGNGNAVAAHRPSQPLHCVAAEREGELR